MMRRVETTLVEVETKLYSRRDFIQPSDRYIILFDDIDRHIHLSKTNQLHHELAHCAPTPHQPQYQRNRQISNTSLRNRPKNKAGLQLYFMLPPRFFCINSVHNNALRREKVVPLAFSKLSVFLVRGIHGPPKSRLLCKLESMQQS